MIHYKFSCSNPSSQFLEIELSLDCKANEHIFLQLPAWRAGRYQLANYAQNIRRFRIKDAQEENVLFEKASKDRWEFQTTESGKVTVCYEYWAGKMDAGSAWADEEQIYVNLINCCLEVSGRSEEEIEVFLDLPKFPEQVSTLLPNGASRWKARDFQLLADSTILAAKSITHWKYQIESTLFHIWIHGEVRFDQQLILNRFKSFSRKLIADFGEFPELEYHFIFQLLPYAHYHGVEHRRGTIITFGPAESLIDPNQMEELLGISCHELYHGWNVCRIRPQELLPYDFSKETYTRTGLILEGITTYMGDLYLLKSGVYDLPTYLKHLEKIIARESSNFGWKNYNILESSYDLWLDGYVPGIPDRKVSIYTRGALLALGIDILLIKNGSSLSEVMKLLWEKFGKPFIGYHWEDFESLIFGSFSDPTEIQRYFSDFVYGYQDFFPQLKSLLDEIGLELNEKNGEDRLLHNWGIRTNKEGQITQIHPDSKAYSSLMRNDRILGYSEHDTPSLNLKIDRLGRELQIEIPFETGKFFPEFKLEIAEKTALRETWGK
ncbi:MAG: M61 family peptidase [Algoriphagus aquaeductus]|uniref:M61 family metallopeptidase n=1 Tax=Algoriphagus aquaeductus TaxID=475299 RepID=UPI0039189B5D